MDGQDPEGLAALVAFHLHRLGIPPAELMQAEISRDHARHLRRGSMNISTKDVIHIATALQLEPLELCRPLTDDENKEWHFYRISARQVTEVWRRVAEATTAHRFSQHQIGKTIGMSQSVINRVIRGERKSPVLNWHDASKIASALNIDEGAEAFIPMRFTKGTGQERA